MVMTGRFRSMQAQGVAAHPAALPWYVAPLRLGFVLLLLATALGKLLDVPGFAGVLATYRALPGPLLLPAALALALVELALAAWLAWGARLPLAAGATALLHALYLAWLGAAWLRGLDIPNCGCFGVFLARPLTGWTLVEGTALLLAAVLLLRGARAAA